jgi:signal peptidase I
MKHAAEKRPRKQKKPSLLREVISVVGVALVLSVLVRTFLIQAFYVPK